MRFVADRARGFIYEVSKWADAVIVGSALIKVIEKGPDAPDLAKRIERFAGELKRAMMW